MSDQTYQYIIPSGIVVPDTDSTLATVQGEWKGTFGSDLIVTADTPQGVMITAESLARNNVIKNNAALANQINPNISGGTFLDAIGNLTGSRRNRQRPTAVTNVTITGVAKTFIASGAQAKTSAGDIFQLTTAVTISENGTVQGNFQSVAFGPIPCPANALNEIVTASILGWETVVNNPSSTPASITTLGQTSQSDQGFRAFRLNTLGFQGISLAAAQTSALYAVPGVTSLSFRENINKLPMGMIVPVAGGATESGTMWAMTTLQGDGSGTEGNIVVGTDDLNFSTTTQTIPAVNPWPLAAFTTTGNITLSGLGTQAGGDWGVPLTTGQIILVKDQATPSQNGTYSAAAGAWSRIYATNGSQILGSNDGLSLIANSVYACVAGGTSVQIAATLLENKSSGAGWNGGTAQSVIEPSSGQSYTVRYDVPTLIPIVIEVTATGVTQDQVVKAILDYQAGTVTDPSGNPSNLSGFTVSQDVSPFELAAAIAIENPDAYVSNVEIAIKPRSGSPSFATTPVPIGLNQQAYTQLSFITVST